MASNTIEMGSKLDWTRDHQLYDRYKNWKKRVEMLMESVLEEESDHAKCNYLNFWLGEEGLPLIQKWEDTKKLLYTGDDPSGHKLDTYWTLLEEEFKPRANRILSVIDLWTNSKQGQLGLSEWITKVYNQVELCHYNAASKDRIIRDVLIVGCNSTQAKDKIIRKGEDSTLKDVLDILQTEEAATRTIQNLNSTNTTTANLHYARYDKRKKSSGKNAHSNSTTDKGEKKCFRCGYAFEKEHLKSCPAKDAECRFCGLTGHFAKCCGKAGKFPKGGKNTNSTTSTNSTNSTSNSGVATASAHTLTAHPAPVQPVQEEYYYDEDGYIHKVQKDKE